MKVNKLLLGVIVPLCIGNITSCEVSYNYYTEGLEFTLTADGSSYEVSKYEGTNNMVVIPSVYDGKPVTSIREMAFAMKSIKNVEIPDSITKIGEAAFWVCYSLESITIPNGVTGINDMTFFECGSLASIKIPESVTSIGDSAFEGCKSLTTITIPDSVISIGHHAFEYCKSLTNIVIPDGVANINAWTFNYCSSLESINIPNSVTKILQYAFEGCRSLKTVYYTGTTEQWGDIYIDMCNHYLTRATIICKYAGE